jgi:hypothetical protein
MNYLLLKEGFEIFVIPNMEYEHVCHVNTLSCLLENMYKDINDEIFNLICNIPRFE